MALTLRQQQFVTEYLKDRNGTQAALRAGYSPKGARTAGSRLLAMNNIRAAVSAPVARAQERQVVSAERVIEEMSKIAFSDIKACYDDQGRLLPIHMLTDAAAASIAGHKVKLTQVPGGEPGEVEATVEIKHWDKMKSLEQLARILALFKDQIEVKLIDGIGERLARARERIKDRGKP